MERVLRKPAAFILAISLIMGMFITPSYAGESGASPVYSEASTANGVDNSFEKQSEIAEVKLQSDGGVRTLSSDSHSGRFSLKVGKSGLVESVSCQIISSEIDLSKYNQVSMWVKPKGYNIPLTVYTQSNGQKTTVGSIAVSNLKADAWQEISFDLSFSSGQITGFYTYAHPGKSLLIDDIRFSKTYTNNETWDLNSGSSSSNTLPTVFSYQDNIGITMKTSTTSSSAYQNGAKVASIENSVPGEITGIKIDSTKSEMTGSMIPTGGTAYVEGIVATNSALYTMSKDGNMIFYYNSSTNSVERKNLLTNESRQIYNGQIKMIKTNEDGSMLALVDTGSALFVINEQLFNSPINPFVSKLVTVGAITNLNFKNKALYYCLDKEYYVLSNGGNGKSDKIIESTYMHEGKADDSNASLVSGSSTYKYYYYPEYYTYKETGVPPCSAMRIIRHNNFTTEPDVVIVDEKRAWADANGSIIKANNSGSMVLYKAFSQYYLLADADTSNPIKVSLGTVVSTPYFIKDQLFYYIGTELYGMDRVIKIPTPVKKVDYIADIIDNSLLYIGDYGYEYLVNKTFNFDKELLFQITTQSCIVNKPTSSATIANSKFSTLPNQVITQMENGDVYSVDTRTKTSRLIISNMVFYDVLDQGRLLLSDMKDTGRFLIYDPTSNSKEVFRLDNRSTGAAFTIQFNEEAKSVYYLNNENKIQVRLLTGAETQDKYAIMMNNDNKWWVYKNNAWKNIYTGSDSPSVEIMGSMGMTATEVNAITEKDFQRLPENAKADALRIAVYLHSSSPYATPVLKSINVSTKDTEADLEGKTLYGARIKEYNKTDFRDISAIHVIENKDSTDEIYYFLVADGTLYSIRNGEACEIGKSETQMFGNIKDNYMDMMSYGMSAKELADFPADLLKKILITDNTTDRFGIAAVMKTIDKDTKEVKLDYALESLKKRFVDDVTTIKITLTDDTQIQYTSGEVSKEEIEKFTDWVMDRKYNRGPVFFTFHVGNQYKIINYYMIKMFSVE